MKIYASYAEFKEYDRGLRNDLTVKSDEYLAHVKDGLNFFHTHGNHNIQIVNDLLDTASAGRFQRNRVLDWIAPLVGHETIKLTGGKFGFGAKVEGVSYDEIIENAPAHFVQFPDWYAFKKENDPETFEAEEVVRKVEKYLAKIAKNASAHGYSLMGAKLDELVQSFKAAPILTPDAVVKSEVVESEVVSQAA